MISRVAETCFWMQRHLERAEATGRLLEVNRILVPDVNLPELSRWRPLVVVAGEEERFASLIGPKLIDDGNAVQNFLVWDDRCPVSVQSDFYWARENARTIREIISPEVWESLNTVWLWMGSGKTRFLYNQRRGEFYRKVKRACMEVHGAEHGTMPVDEAMFFVRLGGYLERGGQTARMLDMLHHSLGSSRTATLGPIEVAQWLAILRTCSAEDAFFKASRAPLSGRGVADFLIFDERFPRSVMYCVRRCQKFLELIRAEGDPSIGTKSLELIKRMTRHLRDASMDEIIDRGLHHELTWIVDWVGEVALAIEADYFQPTVVNVGAQKRAGETR